MKKRIAALLVTIAVIAIAVVVAFSAPVLADVDMTVGSKVFNANCTACHLGGGNVVAANKNLKADALKQYGMDSAEAIISQVTNGKNAMPAFKGRLTPDQIESVAAYVLAQSEKGWTK
ncbi:c-type cytochrome [Leptolyngbya sp. FACHB-36]|uniref:cytochrome c6 PetJ n=1 Tax=Leptolyngbya sp. FACHB-36 TaxID=2692808 RepID=UPI0016803F83|nr:c-type cytochrome [Leptolyngbya sp. FACHB-36]MBD2020911.1 c-type cytochrome [Leptolyngbya sp. FACHB-36]